MSFLMHVVALVSLCIICDTTLHFPSCLGLSFKIQIWSEYIIAYFISFDSPIWTLKSNIIRPSYELFDCMRSLLSHSALFVTQLYFFFHISRPEFQNSDFVEQYHSLLRYLWFAYLNSKIRYHTTKLWAFWCMWALLSLSALFASQLYVLFHVSQPQFQNSNFVRAYHSLICELWFTYLNSKIRYHTTKLWPFWCMRSLLSLTALFVTQLYFEHLLTICLYSSFLEKQENHSPNLKSKWNIT